MVSRGAANPGTFREVGSHLPEGLNRGKWMSWKRDCVRRRNSLPLCVLARRFRKCDQCFSLQRRARLKASTICHRQRGEQFARGFSSSGCGASGAISANWFQIRTVACAWRGAEFSNLVVDYDIAEQQKYRISMERGPLSSGEGGPSSCSIANTFVRSRLRRQSGFERDHTIQKPRLVCEVHGFRFIKAGYCEDSPSFARPFIASGGWQTGPQRSIRGRDRPTQTWLPSRTKQLILWELRGLVPWLLSTSSTHR